MLRFVPEFSLIQTRVLKISLLLKTRVPQESLYKIVSDLNFNLNDFIFNTDKGNYKYHSRNADAENQIVFKIEEGRSFTILWGLNADKDQLEKKVDLFILTLLKHDILKTSDISQLEYSMQFELSISRNHAEIISNYFYKNDIMQSFCDDPKKFFDNDYHIKFFYDSDTVAVFDVEGTTSGRNVLENDFDDNSIEIFVGFGKVFFPAEGDFLKIFENFKECIIDYTCNTLCNKVLLEFENYCKQFIIDDSIKT